MSGSLGPALLILTEVVDSAAIIYAAYWGFAIRRALVGRIYRNQALWLGVLSILLFLTVFVPAPTTSDAVIIVLSDLPIVAFTLAFFAFVDSTVPVARRSDPRLRNILHWDKIRFVAWGVLVLVEMLGVYSDIMTENTGSNDVVGLFVLAVIGAPPMFIAASRSMDRSLRGSLKWLGLTLLFFLGILLVAVGESAADFSDSTYSSVPYGVVLLFIAYALYKSTRSLAPINRLPAIEPGTPSSPDATKT
jgi:hypothetical protein